MVEPERPPQLGPRQDEVSRAELLTEGTNGLLFANGGGAAVLLALLEFMPELRVPVVAAGACLVAGVVFALFVTLARFDLSKKYWASSAERTAVEKVELARLADRWRRFYISSIVAFSLGVSIVLFAAVLIREAT